MAFNRATSAARRRSARRCSAGLRAPSCSASLVSAKLKRLLVDLIRRCMVDVVVSAGAGFKHCIGMVRADDEELRRPGIDRIYDTFIDEDELRSATWRSRSSPRSRRRGEPHVSIDGAREPLELPGLKMAARGTGLVMLGGGTPKNFAQDAVVASEMRGGPAPMHKYAVQLTVAGQPNGALSGSTLREPCSWRKVDTAFEQMAFGEATTTMPLLASATFHGGSWRGRGPRRLAKRLFA